MCFLQRLQGNMVFCAKQTSTCGSMQKIHQQLVLCAISSSITPWRETVVAVCAVPLVLL
jgi:hypothetical protein